MGKLLSVKLDGFDETVQKLRAFPDAIGESGLRRAAVAGAGVIRDEAVLLAPERKGVLKRNVIMRHIEEASDGANHQTYYVTVRSGGRDESGNKDRSNDAFYWRWVEFGTSKSAAHPFMRPAFEARIGDALKAARTRMAEYVASVFAEMAK
jgi:HK97 gp10 family phage protein